MSVTRIEETLVSRITKRLLKMTPVIRTAICSLLLVVSLGASANQNDEILRVATYECPPFVFDNEGEFSGLSIFLLEQISEELDVEFQLVNYELDPLLDAVESGEVNAGVSCLSITKEREEVIDFSHSYYETHLAIAVKNRGIFGIIKSIFANKKLLIGIGIVCLAAGIIGGLLYYLEHNLNEKLYSGNTASSKLLETFIIGLLFVTRGPINYYEFKTFAARVISAILAVGSTLFIASMTAVLASAFTVDHLRTQVSGPHDLAKMKVGAKDSSTSSEYLVRNSIPHRSYETIEELLDVLEHGKINAIVADGAVLKYLIKAGHKEGLYEDLTVLPYQFGKQNYGFAFGDDNPNIEKINQALLSVRNTDAWNKELLEYFNE